MKHYSVVSLSLGSGKGKLTNDSLLTGTCDRPATDLVPEIRFQARVKPLLVQA